MRMLKISAAVALMAGSLGLTTPATAQRYDNHRTRVEHVEHRYEGRGNGHRYERSHRRDWRDHRRSSRCRTEWRHHHRVRVCR